MKKNTWDLVKEYVEKAERVAVLEERIATIKNICWQAEEEYAKRKKELGWDANINDVVIDVHRILDVLWSPHSSSALDILIEMEKEKAARLETDDDE